MTKLLAILLVVAAAAGAVFVLVGGDAEPETPTAAAARGDVVAELITNGRIEPSDRFDVRADAAGVLTRLAVESGDLVRRGEVLATVESSDAQAAVERAQAQLDAAHARLAAVERGLTPAERADHENRLALAERTREALRADAAGIARLVERAAAPRAELDAVERRIAEADSEISRLRTALEARPAPEQLDQARAAVREARIAAAQAERDAASAVVRAPASGRVYSVSARAGDYLARGDLIARLAGDGAPEARVFVDEPELGRIEKGAAARLTADAYPSRTWTCRIERLPTEIIELDNRRVGEVRCVVEGAAEKLIPNLTVNVVVQTDAAVNALLLPREAVRRDAQGDFVLAEDGSRRAVQIGVRGPEFVEISSGLTEGDRVRIPAGGAR